MVRANGAGWRSTRKPVESRAWWAGVWLSIVRVPRAPYKAPNPALVSDDEVWRLAGRRGRFFPSPATAVISHAETRVLTNARSVAARRTRGRTRSPLR